MIQLILNANLKLSNKKFNVFFTVAYIESNL